VRATTAFNRLLALPGVRVIDVLFAADGTTVRVALVRRLAACSGCGQVCRQVHDRAWRRWRHLDLAGGRCHIEYELRRVRCANCGVRVEAVPFARQRARHTRDFEDLVAFCAQQMAKAPITKLLRVGWDTVGTIVARVVADRLDHDRLAGLVTIGCDRILAAIRLAISNGRMEGLNSKARLLSHRSFGFHGPEPLIALIYLCCSDLTITPPLR
jgi:transposase